MNWQTAKQRATEITGRTPRWCDVRNEEDQLAAAPSTEAMDDYIALDANGNKTQLQCWMNEEPRGADVEAVCYF